MATRKTGYFRLPPREIGATLILPPTFVGATRAGDLAEWARDHGFGDLAYVPGRFEVQPCLES